MVALLAGVWNALADKRRIEFLSVGGDFADVISDELLGLPPPREVEFTIETLSGMSPIALPLHMMAPAEQIDL